MTASRDTRWWTRDELTGGRLVWLAVLDWPAGPLWLAQDERSAPDPDTGETVRYRAGLGEVEWSEEMALWDASAQPRGAVFPLRLDHLDIPALIEQGHSLHGARFRLYRHIVGTSRLVLYIDGRVQDFDYGERGDLGALAINVESNPWDDGATTHDPDEAITSSTWSGASARVMGEAYPKVFGRPGFTETVPVTPAYPIKSNVLLVSAGETLAGKVDVYDKDRNRRIGCDVIQEADGLGRIVSTVDVTTGSGSVTWAADERFWCRFSAYTMPRPGAELGLPQAPVRTAGHLLTWALSRSRGGWNRAGVEAAADALSSFIVDGAIVPAPDQPLGLWEWLNGALLPLLPVSMIWTPGGANIKVWRWDDFRPLATLVEGLDVHRFGGVSIGRADDLRNETRLRYALDSDAGGPTKIAAMVGSSEAADREVGAALYHKCAVSQARYRGSDGRVIVRRDSDTTDIVEDETTARAIVRWRAEARALPLSRVTVEAPQQLGYLRVGDDVAYTDATLGWTARRAVIEAATYLDDGRMDWTLAVFDRAHTP